MTRSIRSGVRAAGLAGITCLLCAPLVASASTTPAGSSAVETTVAIEVDGHDVPGTLTVPAEPAGPVAAVLMLHGFASQKDEVGDMYAREAQALADLGIASLRIDFAGTGDSTQPYTDNTWTGMVADAVASYDFLVAQDMTEDSLVGVLGFSMGSKVGLAVVAERPEAAAFASWSGALYDGFGGTADEELWQQARDSGSVVEDLGFTTVELSLEWFESMDASTALTDASGYVGPVLAVAGGDDTTVPSQVSQDFLAALNSPDESLRVIAGADHIYHVLTDDQTLADEVIDLTADWFDDRLTAA